VQEADDRHIVIDKTIVCAERRRPETGNHTCTVSVPLILLTICIVALQCNCLSLPEHAKRLVLPCANCGLPHQSMINPMANFKWLARRLRVLLLTNGIAESTMSSFTLETSSDVSIGFLGIVFHT
jgi:hypothetical protein